MVDRDPGAHRVVAIFGAEAHRRHHQEPVRVDAAGLVQLGAADHDAVGVALDDAHEQVRIVLLVRRLAAVALGVGHRAADHEVLALHVLDEVDEALVVLGVFRLIDVVGDREQRVDRVHADAALKARAGALAEPALHAVLHHHVVDAFGHLQKAVHALAGELALDGGELRFVFRERVRLGDRVDRGADHRVIDRLLDQLAEQVDAQFAVAEALDVLAGDS